ncbi:MAG TPA: hypothetical protein VKZ59_15540 [Acidobacteriota bacterium]|nr:hypothetical protein [Acidobacteriota bacterium]
MIVLPSYPARRAWLQSFGISVSLAAGVGLLMFGLLAGLGNRTLVVAPVLTVAMVCLALRVPRFFSWPYRIWNRLAYAVSALVEWWSLKAIHWIMMLSAGESRRARREIEVNGPRGNSSWRRHDSTLTGIVTVSRQSPEPLSGSAPPSPGQRTFRSSSSGRFSMFIDQLRRPDEIWALRVLPCLYILSEVRTPEATQERQENIYTLF